MRVTRVLSVALLFAVVISSCTSEDSAAPPSPQGTEAEASPEEPAGTLKEIECHRADRNTFKADGRCWRLVSDSKNHVFVTTTVGDPEPDLPAMPPEILADESYLYIRAHADPLCRFEEPACGRPSEALWISATVGGIEADHFVSIEAPAYPVGIRIEPGLHPLEIEAEDDQGVKCPGTINVEAPPGQVLFVDVTCLL